jgi:hypothetical protein
MSIYSVTVHGFGHVRTMKVEAESATDARQKAMVKCGINTVTKREPKERCTCNVKGIPGFGPHLPGCPVLTS